MYVACSLVFSCAFESLFASLFILFELHNKIVLGELCAWHEAEEAAAKLQQSGEERDIEGIAGHVCRLVDFIEVKRLQD